MTGRPLRLVGTGEMGPIRAADPGTRHGIGPARLSGGIQPRLSAGAEEVIAPPRQAPLLDAPVRYARDAPDRLSGPDPDGLWDHLDRFGPRPDASGPAGDALIGTLEQIALTGRGGGHFPAARKWRAVLAAGGGGTVVANGAEGEPASAKDAALLQHRPHLVLDGLAAAVEAVGATEAVIWLHEGANDTQRALNRALAERRSAGLPDPQVRIATGPDRYLSGESSTIVRALSGGPALPEFRRRPAAVDGIDGRPTLLHNVETLARVALAARTGADGYTETSMATVVGRGSRLALEVDAGRTIGQVVHAHLHPSMAPHAVLLGGYGGTWLPWHAAAGIRFSEPALRAAGASLGAGLIAPLPAGACGIAETAAVVDYLANSSAAQCGPCLFGLRAIADLMLALADGQALRGDVRRLVQFAGEVDGRGGCHHPDGAVRLVRSALQTFADDVQAHLRQRVCLHDGDHGVLPVPGRQ